MQVAGSRSVAWLIGAQRASPPFRADAASFRIPAETIHIWLI
jgi:hypothetical protein